MIRRINLSEPGDLLIFSLLCMNRDQIERTILSLGLKAGFFIVKPQDLDLFEKSPGVRPIVDPAFFNEPNAGALTRDFVQRGAAYIVVNMGCAPHVLKAVRENAQSCPLIAEVSDPEHLKYPGGILDQFSWASAVMAYSLELLTEFRLKNQLRILGFSGDAVVSDAEAKATGFEEAFRRGVHACVIRPAVLQSEDKKSEIYEPTPLFGGFLQTISHAKSSASALVI